MRRLMPVCSYEVHAALKNDPERVRAETTFVGVQLLEGELLGYLRNCACGSTILLTPTQEHAVLSAMEAA